MHLPVVRLLRFGPVAAYAVALLLAAGCRNGSESAGTRHPPEAPLTDSAAAAPRSGTSDRLADRVWVRSDSTGLPGVMRIFLGDGTLVMDSCWETYRLARWQRESDSTVRWQEDASDIRATIRSLTDDELVLVVDLRDGGEEQRYTAARVPYLCPDMKR